MGSESLCIYIYLFFFSIRASIDTFTAASSIFVVNRDFNAD